MRLHKARVTDRVERSRDTDATIRLLHDHGEDKASIHVCFGGDGKSRVVEASNFIGVVRGSTVNGAGIGDEGNISVEPV